MRILTILFFLCVIKSYSQIGIGTISPDQSSMLDVLSTEKGMLIPRMTSAERDAIATPAKGLLVYNTDEDCLQVNKGTSTDIDWSCVGGSVVPPVVSNCNTNGFEGLYVNGQALTASNKFSLQLINNGFTTATPSFSISDLDLPGMTEITVSSVTPTTSSMAPGDTLTVEYGLSGLPTSTGVLTGVWTKLGLTCTKTINITNGDAFFDLPQTLSVISIGDGGIDYPGIIDNGVNQLTVNIPYTGGLGTYDAFSGVLVQNNTGTEENGDINSFYLTYPGGTFSSSGSITATIVVDGDGSFDAKKQLFGSRAIIAALEFQVNGNSKGIVNMEVLAGIPDRNFADPDHQFIYIPIDAADGRTWLNNNLGANYAKVGHAEFNPFQQAIGYFDYHAYGSLFQWGRFSDGHELMEWTSRTSGSLSNGAVTTQSTSHTPGHNQFIDVSTNPRDWLNPQDNNLWQGVNGVNNPCPTGYRLPTKIEIDNLVSAYGITSYFNSFTTDLVIVPPGFHTSFSTGGSLSRGGDRAFYWTSTVSGIRVYNTRFTDDDEVVVVSTSSRALGLSVRCIKD